MEFQSFCIFSCILTLFIVQVNPLTTNVPTVVHLVTVAPLVQLSVSTLRKYIGSVTHPLSSLWVFKEESYSAIEYPAVDLRNKNEKRCIIA